jgi:tellurite resistance protein TerC
VIWPLFGVTASVPHSATETEFALIKLLSCTASVPVVLDEYKPSDMAKQRLNTVPPKLQHRVLLWGILGALVMRAVFTWAGAALLQSFHWVIYVFGGFLVLTGIKLLVQRDAEVHPERNPVLRLFRRAVPAVDNYRGSHFLVREGGKWFANPLLMVLVVIEATDIVFAVDSIPAIFAVTSDPFIVFASNIFAILGLRALYFALAARMGRFHYLKVGLGLVLAFVGVKMVIVDIYKIPIAVSLLVVVGLLTGSVVTSLLRPPAKPPLPVHPPHEPGEAPPIFPPEEPARLDP